MKMKKFCVLAVSLCLILSLEISAYAAQYSDTASHWAEKVIEKWSEMGVINGYDGKFYPDKNITRGDMAIILCRAMLLEPSEQVTNSFLDLDINTYYANSILALNEKGVMQGNEGRIRPLDAITREEAFSLLVRLYEIPATDATFSFADMADISDWAYDNIRTLCVVGIVNGNENKINPKAYITRAEVLQTIDNVYKFSEEKNSSVEENIEIVDDSGKQLNTSGSSSSRGSSSAGSSSAGSSSAGSSSGGSSSGGSSSEDGNSSGSANSDEKTDPIDQSEDKVIGSDDLETGGLW